MVNFDVDNYGYVSARIVLRGKCSFQRVCVRSSRRLADSEYYYSCCMYCRIYYTGGIGALLNGKPCEDCLGEL